MARQHQVEERSEDEEGPVIQFGLSEAEEDELATGNEEDEPIDYTQEDADYPSAAPAHQKQSKTKPASSSPKPAVKPASTAAAQVKQSPPPAAIDLRQLKFRKLPPGSPAPSAFPREEPPVELAQLPTPPPTSPSPPIAAEPVAPILLDEQAPFVPIPESSVARTPVPAPLPQWGPQAVTPVSTYTTLPIFCSPPALHQPVVQQQEAPLPSASTSTCLAPATAAASNEDMQVDWEDMPSAEEGGSGSAGTEDWEAPRQQHKEKRPSPERSRGRDEYREPSSKEHEHRHRSRSRSMKKSTSTSRSHTDDMEKEKERQLRFESPSQPATAVSRGRTAPFERVDLSESSRKRLESVSGGSSDVGRKGGIDTKGGSGAKSVKRKRSEGGLSQKERKDREEGELSEPEVSEPEPAAAPSPSKAPKLDIPFLERPVPSSLVATSVHVLRVAGIRHDAKQDQVIHFFTRAQGQRGERFETPGAFKWVAPYTDEPTSDPGKLKTCLLAWKDKVTTDTAYNLNRKKKGDLGPRIDNKVEKPLLIVEGREPKNPAMRWEWKVKHLEVPLQEECAKIFEREEEEAAMKMQLG